MQKRCRHATTLSQTIHTTTQNEKKKLKRKISKQIYKPEKKETKVFLFTISFSILFDKNLNFVFIVLICRRYKHTWMSLECSFVFRKWTETCVSQLIIFHCYEWQTNATFNMRFVCKLIKKKNRKQKKVVEYTHKLKWNKKRQRKQQLSIDEMKCWLTSLSCRNKWIFSNASTEALFWKCKSQTFNVMTSNEIFPNSLLQSRDDIFLHSLWQFLFSSVDH